MWEAGKAWTDFLISKDGLNNHFSTQRCDASVKPYPMGTYPMGLCALPPHIWLLNWRFRETCSVKAPQGMYSIRSYTFLHLKMRNHILHTTTKPKERASCEPWQQPPQQSSGNCLEWKGVWDLHHLPGRDTGYNLATAFKRGITCEMPVQSHSILIICQACRFFLRLVVTSRRQKIREKTRGRKH